MARIMPAARAGEKSKLHKYGLTTGFCGGPPGSGLRPANLKHRHAAFVLSWKK
jgi:hypothetical protein